MLVYRSLTMTLIKNLKMVSQNGNRRYREGELKCTTRVTMTTDVIREKGQRGSKRQQ